MNNHKSNNIARSHQRRHRGDRKAMTDKYSKFEVFPEGGNRCSTVYIIREIIPNLVSIKSKTMAKVFDDLYSEEGKGGIMRY